MAAVADLAEYEAQLDEVSKLLLDDPDNVELQAIYDDLTEARLFLHCHASCQHRWAATHLAATPAGPASGARVPTPLRQ